MTTLGKRPLEPLFGDINKHADGDIATPSPKRVCSESPIAPAGFVAGDRWNGIPCDQEDIGACAEIVDVALTDDAFGDLVKALATPSTYQVELAMVRLFGSGFAFIRLCNAIAGPLASLHSVAVDALLYRAASDNCPGDVGVLIACLAKEDDVERALTTAVEENDVAAVEVIIKVYERDMNTPDDSCRRVTCGALRDAVEFGKVAVVDYLAGVCDAETVEELLSQCADDHDDPKAAVFAALWRHADLCAHAYGKSLLPCPALDYLKEFVASGEPCADGCMSNVSDDSDSDTETDDDRDDENDDNNNNNDDGEGEMDRPDYHRPL
ncbi:hypothetical protein pqer_cds_1019 [Pandoravirus quercus]|uniref:Uncharacterized protein n=1 Tax=Pandoravirus quercus TaxID=2107709 RepID=A0A2U7UAG8_9VIRU|nr:hypothetical protein pqer_cds_1019 [Pandoravirus quercus]AVK75441.1 hypothetical protein pqer_cds_1019 [Pandoravirus quercus]